LQGTPHYAFADPVLHDVFRIRIRGAERDLLLRIDRDMSLGLSEREMKRVQMHFEELGREPSDIELQSIAQAWSEHCSYKTSRPVLKKYVFPLAERAFAVGDAGVMEFDSDHVYSLKMESHNHPSAIEPYGGAGTGIGGIVRDILCMGTRPCALADMLFFGDPESEPGSVPSGVKHPRYIFSGVVAGIRDYGNRIGVPTLAGGVWFDRSYTANCLVNAACVGFGRKTEIASNRFQHAGDALVLAGGLTGRDGIHGVNFASRILNENSERSDRGAVQLGDPITKEPLIHALLELNEKHVITSMKDLGGGGLSAVVGEMCSSSGLSACVDIDTVPLREEGMLPWEIWISESQERMLLSVPSSQVPDVLEVFSFWDLSAAVIGRVEPGNHVRVTHRGEVIMDLDSSFLVKPEEPGRDAVPANIHSHAAELPEVTLEEAVRRVMTDLNTVSRDWIVHMYDYEVGGRTAIKPLSGIPGRLSHNDAAVIRPLHNSWKGLAVAVSAQPWLSALDPYYGTVEAVDELYRNIVSVGGRPDALTNCMNFGNPEDPHVMHEFTQTAKGMADAARMFGFAVPSGNVSFYNDGVMGPIMPTASLMGVGIVDDIRKAVSSDLKGEGNILYLAGRNISSAGCSVLSRSLGIRGGTFLPPDPASTAETGAKILHMMQEGKILSCHDVSDGGVLACLLEMGFGGNICFSINSSALYGATSAERLFGEGGGRWIIEVESEADVLSSEGNFLEIGRTGGASIRIEEMGRCIYTASLQLIAEPWRKRLWEVMGES